MPVTLRELRRIGALHIRRRETSKDEVIHKRKCEVLRYLWGYDGGDAQAASEVLQEPVVDSPMDQLLQAVQNWNALVRNRAPPVVTFDLPGGEHLSFRVDYLNADMHETRIYVDPHRATAANITDIQRLRAGCPVNVDQRELADISPAHVIITPAHSIYDVGGNIISDPIWRTIALSITENHIDLRDSKAKEKLLEGGGFKVGGLEAYQVRCYHRSSLCLQACSTFVQAHYPAKKAVRLMVPNDECLLGLDDEARTSALTALIKAEARAARRRTGIDRIVCVYVGSIRGLTTAQVQLLIDSEIGTEPGIPVIATGLHVDELREELRYTFKGEVILCAPTNSHPLHQHGNGALDTRKKDLEAQEARNNPTALLCLNMRTNQYIRNKALLGIDTDTDSYIHHAQPVLRNAARERAARPVDDVRSVLPGQLLQDIREVYALVKRTVVGQTQDQESEERRARNREMFLEWNRARALNENNLANEEREATAQRLVGRTDQQPLRGAQVPPATDEPLRREVGALGGVQRHVTFRDNDSVYEIPPRGALESHSQEEEQTSSGAQDGEMQSPHVTGDDTVPSSKKVTETIWEGILFTLGGAGKAILQGLKIFVTPFQWFYNACRGRTKSEVAPPTQSEGRVVENSRAQGVADEAKIVTEATSHSVQSETIQGQSKS